jgi:hypothetical protein
MKPIDPVARPRRRATSRYGTAGSTKKQTDHFLTPWRQAGRGIPHHLLALNLLGHVGRHGRKRLEPSASTSVVLARLMCSRFQ